ncbi:MAG: tail assembly chaperone [Hespellia sp.]|nr:tail assembly chaperone [Hespellia sp.]
MFELTMNGNVYEFNFGMGFLREINRTVSIPVDGTPGIKDNVGLRYAVSKLFEGDAETLENVLDIANKGQAKRLTKSAIDAYLEDESTDIDEVFTVVMGFLKEANVTKKTTMKVLEDIQKELDRRKRIAEMEGN